MRKELTSILIFVGVAIGLGIFALPFSFLISGVTIGLIAFAFGATVMFVLSFCYGEVVADETGENVTVIALARKFLGPVWQHISSLNASIGIWGSFTASLIISQIFLENILHNAHNANLLFNVVIFFLAFFLVVKGLRFAAGWEVTLTLFLVIGLVVISVLSFSSWDKSNLDLRLARHWFDYFTPYGVSLFSFAGWAAIPFMYKTLRRRGNVETNEAFHLNLKKPLIWGFVIVAVVYLFFIFSVLLASGLNTSEDTLFGLGSVLNKRVIVLGSIIGIINIFTTVLVLGLYLKDVFASNYGFSNKAASALVFLPPLILFFIGIGGFVATVAFLGAVSLTIDGIFILAIWQKAKFLPRAGSIVRQTFYKWLIYGLGAILALGALIEIYRIF